MRQRARALALAVVALAGITTGSRAASPVTQQRDGSLEIGGRRLQCGTIRNALDSRLPNLGVSIPDERLLVMNPVRLARQPEIVRIFVFYHECGHHMVGFSELKADCWGVEHGVMEGWLDKAGLSQVCRSFGDAPETDTHPSGARRCANLDRCFATASAQLDRKLAGGAGTKPATATAAIAKALPVGQRAARPVHLVAEPVLVRVGTLR